MLGTLLSKGRFCVQFIYLFMYASSASKGKRREDKHRCIKKRIKEIL